MDIKNTHRETAYNLVKGKVNCERVFQHAVARYQIPQRTNQQQRRVEGKGGRRGREAREGGREGGEGGREGGEGGREGGGEGREGEVREARGGGWREREEGREGRDARNGGRGGEGGRRRGREGGEEEGNWGSRILCVNILAIKYCD